MSNDEMSALTRRYGAEPEALKAVLCPLLLPLRSLDKTITVLEGQSHARANFTVNITPETYVVLARGRTGKFVPHGYGAGAPGWREIAKGRIIDVDYDAGIATGEIYFGFGGASESDLELAITDLSIDDYLEIDQYGAAAKVLSGLTEYYLVRQLQASGFDVVRMPEDMAGHLGAYANFDFSIRRHGVAKRLEVKSLWGTKTAYARLIHSTTTRPPGDPDTWTEAQCANYYPTSSCKFATQDFFAVSLFLRSGAIKDFAFARSTPKTSTTAYGLPASRRYPDHVNQNPLCRVGDGTWFSSINDVWNLS